MGGTKAIAAAVALAVAGGTGYWLYAAKQNKDQRQLVVVLLGDTTKQLRQALNGPPAADVVSKIDSNLKLAKAPRDPDLALAAEHYIHSAREIARRRTDAERLAREAAMSRRALATHMSAASLRDPYWIRVAYDLKKRVERDHFDLETSLNALQHLLHTLPEAQKDLAAHVNASLLLEEAERLKAHERAEQDAKRAADELEKVRRLALPK
jgi:hypothetical protein